MMALFIDCMGCEDGQHERHREVIKAAPEGGVGGDVCRCRGDCAERNLIWYVVRGNAAQMIPSSERADERRAAGYEVTGPMSASQARSTVLAHSLVGALDRQRERHVAAARDQEWPSP